jgi:integrase
MRISEKRVSGPNTNYEQFVRKKCPVTVSRPELPGEQVSFKFDDDRWHLWDIVKPFEGKGHGTINFSEIPAWLLLDAKLYMAHLWLETITYSNEIHQSMTSLRSLGRALSNFSGRPIDLRKKHALIFQRSFKKQGFSNTYNKHVFRYINDFMSFLRQLYPEVKSNNFIIDISRRRGEVGENQPLGQLPEKKISTEILSAVINACDADLEAYLEAKRNYEYPDRSEFPREYAQATWRASIRKRKQGIPPLSHAEQKPKLRELLGRAVKAQVVKLSICVGRRASSICNSPVDIVTDEIEWTNEAGRLEKVLIVRFRETKIRNVDEDVVCPGAYGDMAIKAIETAKELTAELRDDNPQWGDYLFLVPALNVKSAQVVSPPQINKYLNGENGKKRRKNGLLQRYNIPCAKITTHYFRSTRATNLWLGGMQVHEISDDLGHRGTEMVLRHYIVGTEESMRRYQLFINNQALSGSVIDFVGGQEIVHTRLNARHVEIMKNFGLVVVPTRYGYCARHASLGPCDRTAPCYTGPDGDECDSHVLSPDALPALMEDKEVIETNITTYEDQSDHASWVKNNRNQLIVIDKKIERAITPKQRLKCDERPD